MNNRHCDFMQQFRGFLSGPNHCPGCSGQGITVRGTVCKACHGDGQLLTAVRGNKAQIKAQEKRARRAAKRAMQNQVVF